MSAAAAYIALATGVLVWALLVRKFTAKPWEAALARGVADDLPDSAPARVGLWVFLGVATSLFALFMSAYYMRMGHGHGLANDWQPLLEPPVLWLNSALLILASAGMQWSRASIARGRTQRARQGLLTAGLLAIAFLMGQLYAWGAVSDSVMFTPANPAVAFFYVLTAVHALHLAGGLVVWARTSLRIWSERCEPIDVRLSIELCTVYWHYLLLVWIGLFALLIAT